MDKSIKIITIIFCAVLFFFCVIMISLPKGRITTEEIFEIHNHLPELNKDLPRPIGSIGTLERISFKDHCFVYEMTVKGDSKVIDFYKEKHDNFKTILTYSFLTMDGQGMKATQLARYNKEKGIGIKCVISASNRDSVEWEFKPDELLNLRNSISSAPGEAMAKALSMQVELINAQIQAERGNIDIISVVTNALSGTEDEGILLKDISSNQSTVIFTYLINDDMYDLELIDKGAKMPESKINIIEELATDSDCQELINMISIAHSSIVIRYIGVKSNDTIEITIPYQIVKRYSEVPGLIN